MLCRHHPYSPGHCWAGNTSQPGGWSYCPAAGNKVRGCWFGGAHMALITGGIRAPCSCVSNNVTNVCHTGFVVILSPRGEASGARSCFYCSLSQFKQHIVFAVPVCRGRQRKAACPALSGGVGKFGGGALNQEELIS